MHSAADRERFYKEMGQLSTSDAEALGCKLAERQARRRSRASKVGNRGHCNDTDLNSGRGWCVLMVAGTLARIDSRQTSGKQMHLKVLGA